MFIFSQAKLETEEFFQQFVPQIQRYKDSFYQRYQNFCAIKHEDYQELENTWFWTLDLELDLEETKDKDKKVNFLRRGREILEEYYNSVEEAKDTITYNQFQLFLKEKLFATFVAILKLQEELKIE
jgi:hypothetical protein